MRVLSESSGKSRVENGGEEAAVPDDMDAAREERHAQRHKPLDVALLNLNPPHPNPSTDQSPRISPPTLRTFPSLERKALSGTQAERSLALSLAPPARLSL
eukprot:2854238-Rhodomonas_salina.5